MSEMSDDVRVLLNRAFDVDRRTYHDQITYEMYVAVVIENNKIHIEFRKKNR